MEINIDEWDGDKVDEEMRLTFEMKINIDEEMRGRTIEIWKGKEDWDKYS